MSDYKKCGIDRIGDTISRELSSYTADIQMGIKTLVDKKSNELRDAVKKAAPVGKRKKYRKAIKVKTTNEMFTFYERTVYASKPEYRLTHLLEKPHASKKGGTVMPQAHFAPASEKIHREFEEEVKKLIRSSEAMGGGIRRL